MPLRKGASNKTREANIKEMIDAGHPVKESVAAGYAQQRRSGGHPPPPKGKPGGKKGGKS